MKTYADECLERAEKATDGPWYVTGWSDSIKKCLSSNQFSAFFDSYAQDAEFCARARTDVPELARRLKKACAILREQGIHHCEKTEGDHLIHLADELEAMPEEK